MALRSCLGLGSTISRIQPSPICSLRSSHPSISPFAPRFAGPSRSLTTSKLQFFLQKPFHPPPSFLDTLTKRNISSSSTSLIRSSYFPRGRTSGSGPNGPNGPFGWFYRLKKKLDAIPTQNVIYGLIGINVAVFLLWQYAISTAKRFHDLSLFNFMKNNFTMSEANIMAGRLYTLVTSTFSHTRGEHIILNCLALYFVAPAAASLLGTSTFLGLYLGAGVFSAWVSLIYHRSSRHRWSGSEGASGAIYSCLSFYAAIYPTNQVMMFFVIPMPVWLAAGGLCAWDIYSAIFTPNNGTDSAGHIGGIVFGLIAALLYRKGGRPRRW